VVVVHGAPGANLDRVASAVLGPGLALVLIRATGLLGRDHWARWHRGMLLTVLVDPCEDSWLMAAELAAPTVVVHTTAPQLAWVVDALLRGVHAMIAGDDVPADLGAMLTLVARGYFTMSADYLEPLVAMMAKRVNEGGSGLPELTTREQDILASIASGDTIRQTARALGIAAKTVENTQARLFRKLGTRNRSETLTIAYRLGLVDPATSSDPAAQSETAR
jgi:DNA-binding NarL/FixJ family response regulator